MNGVLIFIMIVSGAFVSMHLISYSVRIFGYNMQLKRQRDRKRKLESVEQNLDAIDSFDHNQDCVNRGLVKINFLTAREAL